MKRLLLVVLLALAAAVLAAGALLLWAVGTESGARFALRRAETLLPYELEVRSVEGRLLGPLTLAGLALRDASLEIEVERARLDWTPRALLGRTLSVEQLELSGVEVRVRPGVAEPPAADGWQPSGTLAPPLGVTVERASIEDLRYVPPDGQPIVVERLRVAGHWNERELLVRELEGRGPLFSLGGRARVLAQEPYEIEARFESSFAPPGYARIAGTTTVGGNLRRLAIEQRIEAPYNVSAALELANPFAALGLDGRLEVDVDLAAVGAELPAVALAAEARVDGSLDVLNIAADARLETAGIDPLALSLEAAWSVDTLAIERLGVEHTASTAALSVAGQAVLGAVPRVDIDGTWSGLAYPLTGEALVASEAGAFAIAGSLEDYAFELDAALATRERAGVPETAGRVQLAGTGGRESLRIPRIDIEALGGRLSGAAELGLAPLAAEVELTARGIDPQGLAEQWPGRLDGTLRAAGALDEQGLPRLSRAELDVDGRLRERPVSASVRAAYGRGTLRIEALSLDSGTTSVEAAGTLAAEADLEIQAASEQLGDLWPGLGGRLRLEGRMTGPAARPRVVVDASGGSLEWPGGAIGRLVLTADVDAAGERRSELEATIEQAVLSGTPVERLALSGGGTAAGHELGLAVASEVGSGRLALTGRVERPWRDDFVWRFALERAEVAPAGLDAWRLQAPAAGRAASDGVAVDETCWQSGDATLCVEGAYGPARTYASLTLSELPLGELTQLLGQDLEIEGRLSAEAELVAATEGLPDVRLSVRSTPGSVAPPGSDAAIGFGPLEAALVNDAERTTAELRLPFADGGRIDANVRLGGRAPAPLLERPLAGELTAEFDELGLVSTFVPAVQDAAGRLHGRLELGGTLGAPALTGALALENASASVPAANIDLEGIGLELVSDGRDDIAVSARAESGGGFIEADGVLRLAGGLPVGRLSARGEGFEVTDTFEMRVVVSPELELTLAPERLELTGIVAVPTALIRSPVASGGAVGVSADEVIVGDGEAQPAASALRPIQANVRLRLGQDVRIDAMGLTGRVGGAITIIEVPDEPTTATGELRVEEGTYEAYGQALEIRTGRLLFAGGPIERPGLDIEAVRRPTETILVGARVRGTLVRPEVSVFSEPPMEQREQLSYLVLGRPLQSTSSAEQSAMTRAAMALGLRGGNFVSERVNETLRLDEFGIQSRSGETAAEASFVIGKYLSPSLYVRYGVGVFDSASSLELRYTISDRWRLVTESSEEGSGGDLLFNIERRGRDAPSTTRRPRTPADP